MPSFLSRLRRVLGWRPEDRGRARGPSMTQLRLPEDREDMVPLDVFEGEARAVSSVAETGWPRMFGHRSSSVGPVARMTARSRTFSSSRMLPGQGYAVSRCMVARLDAFECACRSAPRTCRGGTAPGAGCPRPLAERRELDREDVEPVVEVLAERLLADGLEQVAVGGGDDADVDLDRRRAADPLELALLEDAEQLGLGLRGQLADLVEEERAAVGQLEPAAAPGDRAGEGALLVAEQLALDEPRGQGGAVDLDQRLVALAGSWSGWPGRSAPCRCPVSPVISTVASVGGDAADLVEHGQQRGAAADDLLEVVDRLDLFLEVEVLLLEPGAFGLGEHAVGDVHPDRMDGAGSGRRPRASASSRG